MSSVNGSHSTFTPAASILRRRLASPEIICAPGVHEGFTARLALAAGFETLYMTGAGTSASRLGAPDLALLTLNDMLENASMIASLDPSVPLIADGDVGFGGPLNVARTVKAYISANIAAIHLEDQTITKRCGHLGGKTLVSLEDFVIRIRAAVKAREETGRDLVIIARSDANQSFGFQETVARLKAAVDAGADVCFFEGIETEAEMKAACEALAPTPCLLNSIPGGLTPIIPAAKAQALGYKIQIWPILSLSAVYKSVSADMKRLKENGYVDPPEKGEGELRDCFEVCGLSKCTAFDAEVGGKAYPKDI